MCFQSRERKRAVPGDWTCPYYHCSPGSPGRSYLVTVRGISFLFRTTITVKLFFGPDTFNALVTSSGVVRPA